MVKKLSQHNYIVAEGNKKRLSIQLGVFGLLFCSIGIFEYWRGGFDPQLLWYLLLGLGLIGSAGFILPHKKIEVFDRRDWLVAGVIVAVFTPLYLIGVHDIPRQMNTDEIAIMNTSEEIAAQKDVDLFGPSQYFDFPNLIFWVMGKLTAMLGGMNLENMRLLHATSGVLIVVLSYFLFRQFLEKAESALASSAIGLNHSLYFISRMAMRDNTALLLEVIALLALVYGWRRRHYGWSLIGGVIAGLGFYTYYPSRITIVIWSIFVITYLLLQRFRNWRQILRLSGVVLIGFMVVVLPLFIANSRDSAQTDYAERQLLITKAGRELQKGWVSASDEAAGVRTNIVHGLLSLNRPYADKGNIYPHPGYGFVDFITGVLIWLGIATIIFETMKKRRMAAADLLMLVGFLLIWLSLAFIFTKAPNYTRLLVVLPFIGYMVARAASGIYLSARYLDPHRLRLIKNKSITATLIILILLSNSLIAKDFAKRGNLYGDALGDTVRFQEKHANEQIDWFFAPLNKTSYFHWGNSDQWQSWLSFAKGTNQSLYIIPPDVKTSSFRLQLRPGYDTYLLTDNPDWAQLVAEHRIVDETSITPDGRIRAIRLANK